MNSRSAFDSFLRRLPIVVAAILALGIAACSLRSGLGGLLVIGQGTPTTDTRTLADFHAVEVTGSLDVTCSHGDGPTAVVSAQPNILPHIKTEITDGRLKVYSDCSIQSNDPITVTLTAKQLDAVEVTGSGNFSSSDITGTSFSADVTGSGDIVIGGETSSLSADITGSGDIDAAKLFAKAADVTISGSGDATVYASQSLAASIMGSGSISYLGNPKTVNPSITGSGSVTAK